MSSRYSFEAGNGYLVMRIAGSYDYWDFIQYPKIIRTECEARGIFRILVDVVAVTYLELPTLELFFLGEKVAEVLRDRIKIALVWHGGARDNFLQTVAANRAAAIRIFESTDTARIWLLYDHEDEPFNFLKS
jgi:hypothetical protein